MKKIFVCFTAVMAVALCLTSCKKEEKTNSMQFRATMETSANDNSKTTLNGTNIEWVAGDEVTIYGLEQSGTYTAQPESSDPTTAILTVNGQPAQGWPYCAIYPASLGNSATSFTLPAEQVTVDGSLTNFPMYAKSNDENLAFKNLCGVLKIHLQQSNATVSRIQVIAHTQINGTYNIDNSGEVPAISYAGNGDTVTTLICTTPQDITNGKDFYVIMPAGNYGELQINILDAGYGVEKHISAEIAIVRSKYSTLSFQNVNMPIPPEGGIWGLYSISATEQVWISSGNLQYSAASNTWRFAPEQYSFNHSGWKDLFGWGTSGWDNGNEFYLPTDQNAGNGNSSTGYGYGPLNGTNARLSLTGDYANSDWGVYNAISNGGNQAGLWRTLTREQLNYLVGNAGKRAGGKRGVGTVNNVHGVIILPDYWTVPEGLEFVPGATQSWNSNVYTVSEWEKMEAAGAIFLPAAGYHWGTESGRHTDDGSYWTATNSSSMNAYYLVVSNSNNGGCSQRVRYYSYSVRLVKDYVPANSK